MGTLAPASPKRNPAKTFSYRAPADRVRADDQTEKVLAMLRAAGVRGCTNIELWTVAHAANSRVSDLRQRGYTISSKRESGSVWRYVLRSGPENLKPPPAEPDWQTRPRVATDLHGRPLDTSDLPLFASPGVR